ncbi:1739_t:CDS:1, partial [Entrophospora sp. SA101]
KRKILTKAQKKELCEKKRDNPNIKGIDLAQEYGISTQSVSDILRQSSEWLKYEEGSSNTQFRKKATSHPNIEEATRIWVEQLLAKNLTISGPIIQEKAKEFANMFGIRDFNASSGWLSNFKKRNDLQSYKKRGESMSVPIDEIANMQFQLQEILKNYSPEDIWNCDETAIFWKLEQKEQLLTHQFLVKNDPKIVLQPCSP